MKNTMKTTLKAVLKRINKIYPKAEISRQLRRNVISYNPSDEACGFYILKNGDFWEDEESMLKTKNIDEILLVIESRYNCGKDEKDKIKIV